MSTSQAEFYRGLECATGALAPIGDDPAARARAVHTAVAPLLDEAPADGALACGAGCAHCCHFPVGVAFAEAALLADAIRHDDVLRRRVLADADACADVAWHELVGRRCPLLGDDGRCVRYQDRPLPCRALGSRDADACARSLREPTAVPRDERAWWRGLGAAAAIAPDTGDARLRGRRELRSAVSALLSATRDTWPDAFAAAVPTP